MSIKEKIKNFFIYLFTRVLLILFIIVFIFSVFKIAIYIIESKENKRIFNELSTSTFVGTVVPSDNTEKSNESNINFIKLKEKNSDTIGWLEVPNTDIKFPVVKSNNNDFYLTHNFYKKTNASGWIFMDYANKLDDKNIIIYGHNRKDNTMFGTLRNILTDEWLNNNENKQITFITEAGNTKYDVFSVYQIKVEDYYRTINFEDGEFDKFIETLKSRSIKDFGIEVSNEDSILTLSTCGNNNKYRIILHAKKHVQ